MLSFDSVWFVLYAVLVFNNTTPNNHAWLITDGKIGDQVHCLAIAEALKISYEERVVKPSAPWSWIMPYGPIPFMHQPRFESSPIHGDLPSMIIASGRRTVAYVKHLKCKNPDIKTVFLKGPKTAYHYFDVIWAPWHDNLNQPNAIQDVPHWCWSGKGHNPYVAILAHADALVVTGDSHNMVSESLVVGCPVMVHTTPFLKKKCIQFLAQIHQLGWISYFNGSLSN